MSKFETTLEEAKQQILALAERLKDEVESDTEPADGPSRKTIGNLEKAIEKLRKVVGTVENKFFPSHQALQRTM
jgi:UDP-N-acetyl-D-mannosaminuronate dehydrogenase